MQCSVVPRNFQTLWWYPVLPPFASREGVSQEQKDLLSCTKSPIPSVARVLALTFLFHSCDSCPFAFVFMEQFFFRWSCSFAVEKLFTLCWFGTSLVCSFCCCCCFFLSWLFCHQPVARLSSTSCAWRGQTLIHHNTFSPHTFSYAFLPCTFLPYTFSLHTWSHHSSS